MFYAHSFSITAKAKIELDTDTWKPTRYVHFTLNERGKTRIIDAPNIRDRQVEKLLCNEVLIPLYRPTMIYDNGASQQNRGLHWTYKRLRKHLTKHYRKYKNNGYVLLIDLKKFFPNAPLDLVLKRHEELLYGNQKVKHIADLVIENAPSFKSGKGLPIGVEPSQQEMVALPSIVDNYVKCQLSVMGYAHYMDDFYIIHNDKDTLKKIMKLTLCKFVENNIPVNVNKCKIVPLSKPFKFCKSKFLITSTGRILITGNRQGIKRGRRKFKKLYQKFLNNECSLQEIQQFTVSQLSYYNQFNNHKHLMKLYRTFYALFVLNRKSILNNKEVVYG